MADPFTGEIRAFGFNYAPIDWAMCNGQEVAVQQNNVLYAIIGNTFGGTPGVKFNLPNLQGQAVMHQGSGTGLTPRSYATTSGVESVTLITTEMPVHNHTVTAGTVPLAGQTPSANSNSVFGRVGKTNVGILAYSKNDQSNSSMAPQMVGLGGGGLAHENRQPFLPLNFCICLYGIFPPKP